MSKLQSICFNISSMPINGKIDNPVNESLQSVMSKQALAMPVFDLLYDVDKMVIHTLANHNVEPFMKQVMEKAEVFLSGVSEPLVLDLQLAHPVFPRFPIQLFSPDKGVFIKDNPFFKEQDEALLCVYRYFFAIARLCGYSNISEDKVIEKLTLDVKNRATLISYKRELSLDAQATLKHKVNACLSVMAGEDSIVPHFIQNFMPGMEYQNKRSLTPVTHEGREMFRNTFTPTEWTDEDKQKQFTDLLPELSFDEVGDGCPAYVNHRVRFNRYCKSLLEQFDILSFPLRAAEYGADLDTLSDFYNTASGMMLVDYIGQLVASEIDKKELTLGRLIDAHRANKLLSVEQAAVLH